MVKSKQYKKIIAAYGESNKKKHLDGKLSKKKKQTRFFQTQLYSFHVTTRVFLITFFFD